MQRLAWCYYVGELGGLYRRAVQADASSEEVSELILGVELRFVSACQVEIGAHRVQKERVANRGADTWIG